MSEMRRYQFIYILLTAFLVSVRGQGTAGRNIVSKTALTADTTRMLVQRVYDNGLGDIVQEVQSYQGSSLPSLVVHHEYDEYRRRTRSWLPVTSSGSGFISGTMIGYMAGQQYGDANPYSRTVYDDFLPSQPSEHYNAGAQWQGSGKKVSVTYSDSVGIGMCVFEDGYLFTSPDTMMWL